MAYNVLLSFAMIPFDLVLLFNLHFQHRSTAPYHNRMRRALLFLTVSCVVDVVAGVLSQGSLSAAQLGSRLQILAVVTTLTHLVAAAGVAAYLVSFVRYTKKELETGLDALPFTPRQKWLLYLALPLLVLVLWYEVFADSSLMLVSCYLSLLTYAFFFLTEFPMHDRLRTRLKELEDALERARQAEKKAAEENNSKNDFLTNMSHEIRTPLNAILGMDEMILRTDKDDRIIAYANDIRKAGNALLSTVNEILAFSGIEAGAPETAQETPPVTQALPEETPPVTQALPEETKKTEIIAQAHRFFAPDARVLAVDDTESNLRVAEQLLKQTMIDVETCLSGEACLTRLQQKFYDCILLDHMMPGMDGIETMKAARALPQFDAEKTKIIVLTANAIAGAREMYLAEGFDDYLSKPVESQLLEEMLMRYLPAGKLITASDPRYAEYLARFTEEQAAREQERGESGKADMEILRQVQGVDLEEALRLCTDPSILRTTMADFAESIDDEADLIEQYAKEQDWKNYTIKVHALKSTARLIGATALSEDARFLEGLGNAENTAEILEKTPKLLADYRAYHTYLAPVLQTDDADDTREEIAEDELEEAYEALRDFVEMHDFDSADYIMETLAGYRIPEDKRARYDSIRKAVRRVDRTKLLEELL